MSDQITNLPISALRESPTNSRTSYNQVKLAELADSIKAEGVMQPIVVRPIYPEGAPTDARERYEVAIGHRRLRASIMAGLEWVPTIIRELTDEQVATAQLIENFQREDVTALEEAHGFRRLMDEFGVTVPELIRRTGKSKAFVYGRLKLLQLTDAPRRALQSGQIDAEVAGMISRLPASVQADALDEVLTDTEDGTQQGMSTREAKQALRHLIVDLQEAPFPVDVVGLADKPACSDCPDRAGNDPAMGDMDPMSCARRSCYTAKVGGWIELQVEQAKAEGRRVIEGAEAAEVLRYGPWNLQGFVRADDEQWVVQGCRMSMRDLLKSVDMDGFPTILLVTPPERGLPRLIEVYEASLRQAAVNAFLAKRQAEQPPGEENEGATPGHETKANRDREALLAQLTKTERCVFDSDRWQAVLYAIATRVRRTRRTVDDLRLMVLNALDLGAELGTAFIALAFGWTDDRFDGMGPDEQRKASIELVNTLGPDDLASLLILWALEDERHLSWRAFEDIDGARATALGRLNLAQRYGVDVLDPEKHEPAADPVQTPAQLADLFDSPDTPSTGCAGSGGVSKAKPKKAAKAKATAAAETLSTGCAGAEEAADEAGTVKPAKAKPAKAKKKKKKEQTDDAGGAGGSGAKVGDLVDATEAV